MLVELIDFAGGIGVALLIFGVGSVISVIASARYIDAHLRPLIVVALGVGGLSMAMFLAFGGTIVLSHVAFFLWGLAFGPLVTMYQTAVSKQVAKARDVATSVQSSVFNLSIMAATWAGGMLLSDSASAGVRHIVYMSLGCFIAVSEQVERPWPGFSPPAVVVDARRTYGYASALLLGRRRESSTTVSST